MYTICEEAENSVFQKNTSPVLRFDVLLELPVQFSKTRSQTYTWNMAFLLPTVFMNPLNEYY